MSDEIRTRWVNWGTEEKEGTWPSLHGTGERGSYRIGPPPEESEQAPAVIGDDMPPTQHMGNCKYYTSKSKFRAVTKAMGFEEIGNDTEWRASPKVDPKREQKLEEAVSKAYFEVRDGQAPLSELDKHRCQIINNNLRKHNYDRREYDRDGKLRK